MKAKELQKKYQTMLKTYQIDTPLRLAHFFAQIHHESNDFKILKENLNYSVLGLLETFGRHRISETDALLYGRTTNRLANQEMIANLIYGGKYGEKKLGNNQIGDGYRFRGRGFLQITGRNNYTALTKWAKANGIDADYVNNPDLLLRESDALIAALWFWTANDLNKYADKDDILTITKRINGGLTGINDRKTQVSKYKKVF